MQYIVDTFVEQVTQIAANFRGVCCCFSHNASSHSLQDSIMLTMGCDFEYQAANTWFKNLDKYALPRSPAGVAQCVAG